MADIVLATATDGNDFSAGLDNGPYSSTTGDLYFIYVELTSRNLVFIKSTDGGQNYGSPVDLNTDGITRFDVWPEHLTPGDSGTLFHIVTITNGDNVVEYLTLDTSDDSVAAKLEIARSNTLDLNPDWRSSCVSIIKAEGGNIYIANVSRNSVVGLFHRGVHRSTDGGSSFSSRADVYENTGTSANTDRAFLMLGNAADTNDIAAFYYDDSAQAVSMKVYDDSANTWTETAIASSVDLTSANDAPSGMSAIPRLSDGLTIVTASAFNSGTAASTLLVWELDPAGPTVTALTDVYTNELDHHQGCAMQIDQNDDTLRAVFSGTPGEARFSAVHVYYKESSDGGTTWATQVQFDADAATIHRAVWAGKSVSSGGGAFQPSFSEDLGSASPDEYKTNFDNAIAIAGGASPVAISAQVAMQQRDLLLI